LTMSKITTNFEEKYNLLVSTLEEKPLAYDFDRIRKAWEFSEEKHGTQKRLSGDPYFIHPVETSLILAGWGLDESSIIAGLLHDLVEDAGVPPLEITSLFGEEVSTIVDGVSKISNIKLRGSADQEFVENLRKMFLSMAKDLRVVLIKLADRLHNMRTLSFLPPDKRKRIAQETLEVFAPLAERLGMGQVKVELEDLAFPYLYEQEYKKVIGLSRAYYKKTEDDLEKMKRSVLTSLAEENIKALVSTREKHLYSLWKKLERPEIDWDFSKIHDIVAMRIIVDKVSECYTALGTVHGLYKPVPHVGMSDFIAQPKPNGYRSIHTKVFGPTGRIVEIQIRTKKMHEEAEYGVAAHWFYGEAKSHGATDKSLEKGGVIVPAEKMSWVRQLADWQKEIKDTKEFMKAITFDALSHRNFVFSPSGDVYDLPVGATPVDFAYAVHTSLGNYIKAVKVNGRIVPLSYLLRSGDVVEVIKNKNPQKPSRDWLGFTVTTIARREIKKAYGIS